MNSLQPVLDVFSPIDLQGIQAANFMQRIDKKYLFNSEQLPLLLKQLVHNYFILTIGHKNQFSYSTTYLDTPNDDFYLAHHNGHFNRLKVRFRSYIEMCTTYLEIKEKVKGQKTNKMRTLLEDEEGEYVGDTYLSQNTPYSLEHLEEKINTTFDRITLVSRTYDQRITIDSNLTFHEKDKEGKLDDIIILEIKKERTTKQPLIEQELRKLHIRPSGFSKYCFGRALLEENLKQNNFKKYFRKIEQISS